MFIFVTVLVLVSFDHGSALENTSVMAPAPAGDFSAPTAAVPSIVRSTPTAPAPIVAHPPAPARVHADIGLPVAEATAGPDRPVRVSVPSIKLNAPIVGVGINAKGEMDVPSGRTNNVGWYEYGTVPGGTGSAVLDAHVFAAFGDLRYLKPGNDIFITMESGATLHFRVSQAQTYLLKEVPLERLFNEAGGSYLHLITCAGTLTPDRSTYDHRLIVYAELVH